MHFRTPYTSKTIKHKIMFDLVWQAISDLAEDEEEFYMTEKAGISVKFHGGLASGQGRDRVTYEAVNPVLLVSGYDPKFNDVFEQTIKFIFNFFFTDQDQLIGTLRALMSGYVGILKRTTTRKSVGVYRF